MSPAFETFVARLYVDETLRRAFLADAAATATRAGLMPDEIRAVCAIDRTGLELAARVFEHKRRRGAKHPAVMLWRRLTGVIKAVWRVSTAPGERM
jgi:hypothetical protein